MGLQDCGQVHAGKRARSSKPSHEEQEERSQEQARQRRHDEQRLQVWEQKQHQYQQQQGHPLAFQAADQSTGLPSWYEAALSGKEQQLQQAGAAPNIQQVQPEARENIIPHADDVIDLCTDDDSEDEDIGMKGGGMHVGRDALAERVSGQGKLLASENQSTARELRVEQQQDQLQREVAVAPRRRLPDWARATIPHPAVGASNNSSSSLGSLAAVQLAVMGTAAGAMGSEQLGGTRDISMNGSGGGAGTTDGVAAAVQHTEAVAAALGGAGSSSGIATGSGSVDHGNPPSTGAVGSSRHGRQGGFLAQMLKRHYEPDSDDEV
jgi:hypothetical protein